MYEGGSVDILINPEDPTDIKLASQDAIDIVGILVGGVLAGGLGLFLASLKYIPWKKKKDLLEFGYFINAVVDSVEEDLSITAGKKHEHPYIVYCTHTDEVTGMKYMLMIRILSITMLALKNF